ncbi:MAG TPA: DegT/DnrJ/EryC1/StrS family aminotransferase [Pseudonocardiaceae bacterium]|nr:DegT/DnrJ/EryC1/StrS family aminotransferase [Pseudonocardiaceae bacterium]
MTDSDNIALGQPTVGDEELQAVAEVFRSGWLAGQGPTGRKFEEEFAAAVGVEHALAVNNCTAALHLALLVHGVGPGDEVIVADYTFPATGHAVLYTGARPVFADVLLDTGCVDPAAVEALVGPKTVGIIGVDSAGLPADYVPLQQIADRHGLFLVEDAACSSGATYQGRNAGTLAEIACFSFHGRKGITSGEGGAIVTNNAEFAAKARKLHAFGIESALSRAGDGGLPVPTFTELGYNYKLSDIAAAIMRAQLRRQPSLIDRRRKVAAGYQELLGDVPRITLQVEPDDREHAWQTYTVLLDDDVDRGAVATGLRAAGIGCNIGTYASHLQPVYGDTNACPVSRRLFEHNLAIPMHANLTDPQVERVAGTLRQVLADQT